MIIRPIGLPIEAKKSLAELKKMGFKIKPLLTDNHYKQKFLMLDTKSGKNDIVVLSDKTDRAWSRGKTYKAAVINMLKSISGEKFKVTDVKTGEMKEFTAPDYDFMGFKTFGGYERRGNTQDEICYIKTLANGQKIQVNPRGSWWSDLPCKIITSSIASESQDQYRVYQDGHFLHFWLGEDGKHYQSEFIPTKLGNKLSNVIRNISSFFVSNDEKELLEIKHNLKGKVFGRWINS